MTDDILCKNENTYFEKYGESLSSRWSLHPTELRKAALDRMKEFANDDSIRGWVFSNDEILRVIIGYINKRVLADAFENANKVTRILLWEPEEPLFEAGCIIEDLSEYIKDDRFVLVIGRNEEQLNKAISTVLFDNNVMHKRIIAYGSYLKPGNEYVRLFEKLFTQYAGDLQSKMHFRKQYEEWPYKNMLYAVSQLSENSTSIQLFDSIPTREVPVIIVAAGPSLMKNHMELKRAKGKAVIIAVAHAMKTLAASGIEPDLVATTDPKSPFFLDFDEERIYHLLSCIYVSSDFQKAYNGKLIYYGFPMFRECFSCERIEKESADGMDTGSVATDVFSMFVSAGFRKFILVGQDLAFDERGFSHTDGQKENVDYYVTETEGIYGGKVKARGDWEMFRKYYEQKIAERKDIEVIDATEGGALIHGTNVMTLREAIEDYCVAEYPIDKWIDSLPKGDEKEKEFIKEWFIQQNEMCMRTYKNLDRAIDLDEYIIGLWSETEKWDKEFAAKCKKYDIIYDVIMNGSDSTLLRAYCSADIERYIEDAFTFDGDDNTEARIRNEEELFKIMKLKLEDMMSYIQSLKED